MRIKETEIKIIYDKNQNKGLMNLSSLGINQEKDQHDVRRKIANFLRTPKKNMTVSILGSCENSLTKGVAKIIIQEILKVLRTSKKPSRKIVLCLSDQKSFRIFRETVFSYVKHLQDDLGWGPYVTVDIIIEVKKGIVLIERLNSPYGWALPGGFLDYGESLEETAIREAKEETNLKLVNARQFHTYSKPGRDPRFDTVSTVFIAKAQGQPQSGDDAKALKIVPFNELLKLDYAFDHKQIIKDYLANRLA